MRFLSIILSILFVISCQSQEKQEDDIIPETIPEGSEIEKSVTYDSAQFSINRVFYISGQLCFQIYRDSVTKLRYEKKYYIDGKLAEEGGMDDHRNFHVGVWKYYLPSGQIKKISFDSKAQISYYKAIQIAKSHWFDKGRIEISEELFDGTYYWNVKVWTEESCGEGKGEYMMIRRSNGKVTIPKNNKIKYIE